MAVAIQPVSSAFRPAMAAATSSVTRVSMTAVRARQFPALSSSTSSPMHS